MDRFKHPEEPKQPLPSGFACAKCKTLLNAGHEAIYDQDVHEHFCNRDCFKAWVKEFFDEEFDRYWDMLRNKGTIKIEALKPE